MHRSPPRTSRPRRRWQPRRLVALVGASLGCGLVGAATLPALGPASAAEPFAYTVELLPAGPYTDGQAFTVRVTGVPGMRVTNSGFCAPDMPAAQDQDDLTEWCTSTVGNGATGGTVPADPDGVAELVVRAGVGSAEKVSPALGTSHSWMCDPTSPCRLSLVVTPPTGSATFDTSVQLTYRDEDDASSCGGPAADQLATAAPDRLTEAWVAWTVGQCGSDGAATSASFANDGAALAQFGAGSVDLAYSGVPVGTAGFGTVGAPAVHTPVALNATVLAVAGSYPTTSSVPGTPLYRPIDDIRLSNDEAAALLSGNLNLREDLQASLIARNPQLQVQALQVGITTPSSLAGPQATTHQASRLLEQRAGAAWAYPNSASKFGEDAGKPLGTFADYNLLTNNLAVVNLFTGKPQLVGDIYKKLAEKPQGVSLVSFYLTDLATARQLGITPVAVQDAAGAYLLPTPETLAAAVPKMDVAADGTRSLDPAKASGAYPLTFVEYAVSPATTPAAADCTPNPDRAAKIRSWVGYASGPGQDELGPTGLVPLPADLRAEATETLAAIGASAPTTGPCAPATTTTPTATTTIPTSPTIPEAGSLPIGGGLPSGGLPGGGGFGTGGPPVGGLPGGGEALAGADVDRAAAPDTESVAEAELAASTAEIPRLPGPLGTGVLVSALTLPLLVAVTSATGWLSGGRPRRVVPGGATR